MKKIILVIVILGLGYLTYLLLPWIGYTMILTNEESEYREKLKSMKISGRIYWLKKNFKDECFTNFIIRQNGGRDFASGICICNKNREFGEYADEGDSVVKERNTYIIKVIKTDSKMEKTFPFPFCDN